MNIDSRAIMNARLYRFENTSFYWHFYEISKFESNYR